jgi:Activator of Hsp90 ATPase homolog 1-like protein
MSGSKFVYVTYIRIRPEKLWRALTTREIIKQYRFGMSVESEWKVGSTWKMYADGSLMDSGEILESVPPKRLVMGWLCEWKPEFKAEGESCCIFEIEAAGNPRSSHSPIRWNGQIRSSSELCQRVGRWSYRIPNRCLKRGMSLSSIIARAEINLGKRWNQRPSQMLQRTNGMFDLRCALFDVNTTSRRRLTQSR